MEGTHEEIQTDKQGLYQRKRNQPILRQWFYVNLDVGRKILLPCFIYSAVLKGVLSFGN